MKTSTKIRILSPIIAGTSLAVILCVSSLVLVEYYISKENNISMNNDTAKIVEPAIVMPIHGSLTKAELVVYYPNE